MHLAIDIGNSNIVCGLFDGDVLRYEWRIEAHRESNTSDLGKAIRKGLHTAGIPSGDIEGVIIGSVVPPLDAAMAAAVTQLTGTTPLFVDHTNAGIPMRYPRPEEVGADRLANAAGAIAAHGTPCIVVDFGTATTFDYIDADGAYCGGPIAPGLGISNAALTSAAAKLQPTPIAATEHLLPQSTAEAIQAGVFHGYVGLTQYLIEKLTTEVGTNPTVIATGGLAKFIAPSCHAIQIVAPTLTLDGLRHIWVARH